MAAAAAAAMGMEIHRRYQNQALNQAPNQQELVRLDLGKQLALLAPKGRVPEPALSGADQPPRR